MPTPNAQVQIIVKRLKNGKALIGFIPFFDIVLCSLAIFSLMHRIEEYHLLAASFGYFTIDFFDCIIRKDYMFTFHAILSVGLTYGCSLHPVHGKLRSASKGSLVELSTPFLHSWKRNKTKESYVRFYLLFFLCRVLWVPYFLYDTQVYMGELEATVLVGYVFWGLQLVWFAKMTQILITYKSDTPQSKASRKEKES